MNNSHLNIFRIVSNFNYEATYKYIGHGSFSKIYKGLNSKTGEQVAIKIIKLKTIKKNRYNYHNDNDDNDKKKYKI